MRDICIKIFSFFILIARLNGQDFINLHDTRDKINFIKTEFIAEKYFIFYQDSTFFDNRIQCKIFQPLSKKVELEFYLTPSLSTFQQGLITARFKDNLIVTAWIDFRNDAEGDIYAQLIDEKGILWDSAGIPICIEKGKQKNISICVNESGEIFFAWEDFRNDPDGDIYIQKVDFFGKTLWKANGIVVSNIKGKQENPQITHDADEGVYLAWQEKLNSIGQIYVQRIDASGNKKFGQFGIFISNPEEDCSKPRLIRLANNDLLIFYHANKGVEKIYYQQISKKGVRKFSHYGKVVQPTNVNQSLSSFVRLDKDYAIVYLNGTDTKSILLQVLKNGDEPRFKNPITIHSNCKIKQIPEIYLFENKFLIYWTCFHNSRDMVSLFIQEIDFKGNILKADGVNLLNTFFYPDTRICLRNGKIYHIFLSKVVDGRNGIFYISTDLENFGLIKVEEFSVNHYEGHIKLSWQLLNERPGTKLYLERRKDNSSWEIIYQYESRNRLAIHNMSFDTQILENEDLEFRIRTIDPEGRESVTESKQLSVNPLGEFYLFQNSPNPFKDSTIIVFKVPYRTAVKIKLYNARLEEIGVIFDKIVEAGLNEFVFRPEPHLEKGVYFYRIISKDFYDVKKMILNK